MAIDLSSDSTRHTGVYVIRNVVNGKVYVGSASRGIRSRWNEHLSNLRKARHANRHLQAAWIKYGEGAFEFKVLLVCGADDCLTNEQIFIDQMKAANDEYGYNILPLAGSARGWKPNAETRAKMSAAGKGRVKTPEHQAKISAAQIGQKRAPLSVEQRTLLSVIHKGRPKSAEHRAKIAAAHRGRKKSPEHLAKILAANTILKAIAANVGRVDSPERIAKRVATRLANKLAKEAQKTAV